MKERPPTPETIAVHVRAAARPGTESRRLLNDLMGYSWPGGHSDRSEPLARGWLSLWGPNRSIADLPPCACRRGRRCPTCN